MLFAKALARWFGGKPRGAPEGPDPEASAAMSAYAHLDRGDIAQAEATLQPFVARPSQSADVLLVRGMIHKARGERAQAAACFREAAGLRDGFAAAWTQLGSVLRAANDLEEALVAFERAAAIQPPSSSLHHNIGVTRYQLRDVAGATESLETALKLDPGMIPARFALAEAYLAVGDFERGWAEYEHRPHLDSVLARAPIPRWQTGSPLGRIAVIAEQGLGDILMFARFLPRLRDAARSVGVFVQEPLLDLVRESGLAHDVRSVYDADAIEEYDACVPFMSLARMLAIRPQDVDATTPYVAAGAQRLDAWRNRVGARDGRLRVGLAWAGNASHARDSDRSIAPSALAPLAGVEGVAFYSLQVGRPDLGHPPFPVIDLTAQLAGLADTAALIAQLDLVISVDTVIAHLAGGLGHAAWVLCPHRADWRWEIAGRESPWYRSTEVFRPARTAEWAPVIARVSGRLAALRAGV